MRITFTLPSSRCALAVLVLMLLFAGASCKAQRHTANGKAPNDVFGISVSPTASDFLLFVGDAADGDLETGRLELVSVSGRTKVFEEANAVPGEGTTSWVSTTVAYVSAAEGIFRVDSKSESIRQIVRGGAAGLAVSPSGARLAFWELDKHNYQLTVYDVISNRIVKQWPLPATFSGHRSGFDLVFLTEDLLVARTFDAEFRTPLKVFDIGQNSVREFVPNSYSVARVPGGIAAVVAGKEGKTLSKISGKLDLVEVKRGFKFDELQPTGDQRWLVARTSHKNTALINTDTWYAHRFDPGCYPIAIAGSGKAFVFRSGKAISAPAGCVPSSGGPTGSTGATTGPAGARSPVARGRGVDAR